MESRPRSSRAPGLLAGAGALAVLGLAAPGGAELVLGDETVLDPLAWGAQTVVSADFDRDGDPDLAVANATGFTVDLYLNDGSQPPGFVKVLVSDLPQSPTAVAAADLDGDGDVDLASASRFDSGVNWYENLGGSPPAWADHPLDGFFFAGSYSVEAGDLDRDGDVDLALAARGVHVVAWLENDGGAPPAFAARVISEQAYHASNADVDDLDGDGDLDLVVGEVQTGRVSWWENDGAVPPSFTDRTVSPEPGARVVSTGDLDRDGDLDVVAAVEHGPVAWYESDGGQPPAFTRHELAADEGFTVAIHAADADCDGDTDVFTSSVSLGRVSLFESDGAAPPSFTRRTVLALQGASSVAVVDLDDDRRLDLAVTSIGLDRLSWLRNVGGVGSCAACRNGADDDGDGRIDHPLDGGCRSPADASERRRRRCGAGLEAVPALGLLLWLRRWMRRR